MIAMIPLYAEMNWLTNVLLDCSVRARRSKRGAGSGHRGVGLWSVNSLEFWHRIHRPGDTID
jgi:hypothetical protein